MSQWQIMNQGASTRPKDGEHMARSLPHFGKSHGMRRAPTLLYRCASLLRPPGWRLQSANRPPSCFCHSRGSHALSRAEDGHQLGCRASGPHSLRPHPRSLQISPQQPSSPRQGIPPPRAAVRGTSNTDVYARPHLHKPTPPREMNF